MFRTNHILDIFWRQIIHITLCTYTMKGRHYCLPNTLVNCSIAKFLNFLTVHSYFKWQSQHLNTGLFWLLTLELLLQVTGGWYSLGLDTILRGGLFDNDNKENKNSLGALASEIFVSWVEDSDTFIREKLYRILSHFRVCPSWSS